MTVEWDSITLNQMATTKFIEQSERDGFEWDKMTLEDTELEKTKARDKKENAIKTKEKLSNKHY